MVQNLIFRRAQALIPFLLLAGSVQASVIVETYGGPNSNGTVFNGSPQGWAIDASTNTSQGTGALPVCVCPLGAVDAAAQGEANGSLGYLKTFAAHNGQSSAYTTASIFDVLTLPVGTFSYSLDVDASMVFSGAGNGSLGITAQLTREDPGSGEGEGSGGTVSILLGSIQISGTASGYTLFWETRTSSGTDGLVIDPISGRVRFVLPGSINFVDSVQGPGFPPLPNLGDEAGDWNLEFNVQALTDCTPNTGPCSALVESLGSGYLQISSSYTSQNSYTYPGRPATPDDPEDPGPVDPGPSPSAVPEPSTYALVGGALLLIGARRWRSRR